MAMPIGELDRLLLAQRLKVVEEREGSAGAANLPFLVVEPGDSIQQAIDTIEGHTVPRGTVVLARGLHSILSGNTIGPDTRIRFICNDAILQPAPNVTVFTINDPNSDQTPGVIFEDLTIKPTEANKNSGQVGVQVVDSDRVTFIGGRIEDCGVGIGLSTTDARGWCEWIAINGMLLYRNDVGLDLFHGGTVAPSGWASFGQMQLLGVGFLVGPSGRDQIGLRVRGAGAGEIASLYRNLWSNVVFHMGAGDTGSSAIYTEHASLQSAMLQTSFEASSGANKGWDIGPGNQDFDTALIFNRFDGNGYAARVNNPNNTLFRYLVAGGRDVVTIGDTRAWRGLVYGDTQPRLEFHLSFPNGGGFRVGPGGVTAPDTQLFRATTKRWRTPESLDVGGSQLLSGVKRVPEDTGSLTYTMVDGDHTILVNAATGNATITLPFSSTARLGMVAQVHRTDNETANSVTVQRQSSHTIEGATSVSLPAQYDWIKVRTPLVGLWLREGGNV